MAIAGLVEQGGTSAGCFAPVPGTGSIWKNTWESTQSSSARVGDYQVPGSQRRRGSYAEMLQKCLRVFQFPREFIRLAGKALSH